METLIVYNKISEHSEDQRILLEIAQANGLEVHCGWTQLSITRLLTDPLNQLVSGEGC